VGVLEIDCKRKARKYLVESFLELIQVFFVLAMVQEGHAAEGSAATKRARAACGTNRTAPGLKFRFAEFAVPFDGAREYVDPLEVGGVKVVLEALLVRRERKRKSLEVKQEHDEVSKLRHWEINNVPPKEITCFINRVDIVIKLKYTHLQLKVRESLDQFLSQRFVCICFQSRRSFDHAPSAWALQLP